MERIDFLLVNQIEATTVRPTANVLKKIGYKVKIYNNSLGLINKKIGTLIPFYQEIVIKMMNLKLLKEVRKYQPRYVLVFKGKNIWPETIRKIKTYGIKTADFFPEYISHWKSMSYLASVYDYFIVPCHYVIDFAKKEGFNNFYYLTFAAELDKNSQFSNIMDYKYDVTFIGSVNNDYYPERVKFLSALTDFDLHIWGNKAWQDTPLKKFYHCRPSDEEMYDIYRHSKIVINIDYHQAPIDGVNIRPFEATACGSLLINDAVSPEIFRLFKGGGEFIPFKDGEDLREKVKYYLEHEEERIKIAKAGFYRTLKDHTYFDRIKQLLNILDL